LRSPLRRVSQPAHAQEAPVVAAMRMRPLARSIKTPSDGAPRWGEVRHAPWPGTARRRARPISPAWWIWHRVSLGP